MLEDFRRTLYDLAEKRAGNDIAHEKDEVAKKSSLTWERETLWEVEVNLLSLRRIFVHSSAPLLPCSPSPRDWETMMADEL